MSNNEISSKVSKLHVFVSCGWESEMSGRALKHALIWLA